MTRFVRRRTSNRGQIIFPGIMGLGKREGAGARAGGDFNY